MENFYAKNETVCFVKQDTVTEKWEITLLFFLKIEESNGVMVEQLGEVQGQADRPEHVQLRPGPAVRRPELLMSTPR